MPKNFHLTVITPEKVIYDGDIASLIVPSELGFFGVLADHAPLIAGLSKGKITLREESGKQVLFRLNSQGFLEVLKNSVTILCQEALKA